MSQTSLDRALIFHGVAQAVPLPYPDNIISFLATQALTRRTPVTLLRMLEQSLPYRNMETLLSLLILQLGF